MQTDATPPPFPPLPAKTPVPAFDDRPLSALAARRRFSIRAGAAGGILMWLGLATLLGILGDAAWVLPPGARLAIGIVLLAMAAVLFVWKFILAPRRVDARFMTRKVEASMPEFGQLLTTARDPSLKGPDVSPVLREELMARAGRALQSIDGRPYLERGRAKVWLVLGILSVLLWLSYLATSREGVLALKRLLHPFNGPTFTTVYIATPDPTFTGQRLPHVEAVLQGRIVSPVTVEYPGPDGKPVRLQMTRISSGHFEATLPASDQSFEYRITGGDSHPAVATMENADPAKWVSSSAEIVMPDYIDKPAISLDAADIDTVEDSKISVRMRMSMPMREGSFELPDGRHLPMKVEGTDLTVTFNAVPGEKVALLKGTDIHGHAIEAVQFKHVIHKDELPQLEWVEPRKDAEATAVAEIPLRLKIKDDYGIASFGVALQVRGEDKTLVTKEYEAKDLKEVSEIATAALEDFPLTIRDNVRIYAWAKDRKPRDGARSNSELRGVDILPFKRKWMKVNGGGGGGGRPLKELAKVEELIKEQRRILSDAFQVPMDRKVAREPDPGADPFQAAPMEDKATRAVKDACRELSTRELKLQDKTAELYDAAKIDPAWKRDDLALLNASADAMGESSVGWGAREDPKLGFDRADAALSDLLELRKNLLTILMEMKPQDGDKPADEKEVPDPLSKLAEEAERLAKEERDVSEQVKKDPEGKNAAAPRRQQDIAQVDAGELFANLMKHPDATPLVRSRMGEAEQQMRVAGQKMNSSDPSTAPPELENAAERLDEVARHLRALDAGKLDETLAAMSAEAKKAAEEAEKAATDGDKGDEGKKGDDGKGEAKADSKGKDGKGEGEGKGEAEAKADGKGGKGKGGKGQGEGDGEGDGQGGGGSPSSKRGSSLAEAAKQAGDNDDVLKSLAGKEEDPDGNSRLDALRKTQGTESLEKKLNDLAQGKGDAETTAKQLAGLAQALDQERAYRQQSRLENLSKAKDEVAEAKKEAEEGNGAIAKAAAEAEAANGGAFSFEPPAAAMEKARKANPSQAKSGKGNGGNNPDDGGGGGEGNLARSLKSFHDPELHRIAGALQKGSTGPPDVRALSDAERRLAELIEQIAGIGRADNSAAAAPPAYRQAVEDYYRALSDDLGDEAVEPR